MSYYCEIGFKEVQTADQLLNIIAEMKKEMWNQRIEIIDDLLENPYVIQKLSASNRDMIIPWIRSIMTLRLIYWRHFNLLGYCNRGEFKNFSIVPFQNSCDQDYDYKDYPQDIPFFKDRINIVKNASDEEILRVTDNLDEEFENLDIDYARRTYLYDVIYGCLNIERFLYGYTDEPTFTRLDVCAEDRDNEFLELSVYIEQKLARTNPNKT